MKTILLILSAIVLLATSAVCSAQQAHSNDFREMLKNHPLDLWKGEPKKPYSVIGPVSVGEEGEVGSQGLDSVVIRTMKDAMNMGADAVVNMQCGSHKFINDHGDLFDRDPWLAVSVSKGYYCTGTAVKYKN